MTTMQVARLHAIGDPMRLEQVPVPEPRPTDVVVEVKACNFVPNLKNVLALYAEWFPFLPLPELPAVFGLDSAGVVSQVGSEVTGWSVGDRIYVNPALSCRACRACVAGEVQACPTYTFMAYFSFSADGQKLFDAYPYGGFAEYLTAPQGNLVRLPDSVTFEQGARFGYLGTAFSALRKGRVGPGSTVLIDGIGGTLGVGATLIALGLGATTILGTGRNADLLADVQALAPDRIQVLAAGDRPVADWVREQTDGLGADVLIDALAPDAPAQAMVDAVSGLRRGGIAVNIGGMMEPAPLNVLWMMTAGISLLGSLWFTTSEAQDMADLVGAGAIDLSVLENQVHRLDQVNEALDSLPARHGGFTNFIIAP
ncbi:alcohol dehydrogenase catalytic domain-containing protein [Klenkia sp. LSe6-5]|uniref:Alcohol dehydrogenase catalytic domain-containing protein n=1 Tax=Klenkia sesuvii TaxID=3103137 RepID=A0ABU8DQM2_9ACTN